LRATDAGDFFVNFSSHPRSADEMVPGLFCSWVWTRFAGLSEAGMRGINLLWAGVALLALARVGTLVSIGWLPLLFALQPFLWYSMDKSQNTVMQMAGGSLLEPRGQLTPRPCPAHACAEGSHTSPSLMARAP
jgi:hypothetical protein